MSNRPLVALLAVALLTAAGSWHSTSAVQAQAGTGTIQGRIRLTTQAPANPVLRMGTDPLCARLARQSGRRLVQEIVLRSADGGLANAFVDLAGTFPSTPVPAEPVVVNQRGCVYTPRVVGARVGQTLRLINSDTLLHNLHSASSQGNDFNTTQPRSGMVFNFALKGEEVMMRLTCDVHSWMTGYVGVSRHPYFAVSNDTGTFTIRNVPAGRHTIRSWHERYGRITQTVTVTPGATATVTLTYSGSERPPANLRTLNVPSLLPGS